LTNLAKYTDGRFSLSKTKFKKEIEICIRRRFYVFLNVDKNISLGLRYVIVGLRHSRPL
jgi:hypothetical protein